MSDIFTRAGKEFYALMLAHALPGALIKAQCHRFAKLRNMRGHFEQKWGSAKYNAHLRENLTLISAAKKHQPVCQPDHFASGKEFLDNLLWTPIGNQRKTRKAEEFSPADTQVLCGAKEIAWVDIWESRRGYLLSACPVFEVRDGVRSFQYAASSWQSGGHFEIVNHA